MKDIGAKLLLAALSFGFAAYLWWIRRQGLKTGEIWGLNVGVSFSREKNPIIFQIANWVYVVLIAGAAAVGVIALLPPHFLG